MAKTKLFNFDPKNGFTSKFSIGGLPVFADDIQNLETASKLFGLFAMLKGMDCVLSGCLVDELNITTNKVTLTEGYILIDDIVYYFEGVKDQTYPFAIKAGTQEVDTRVFKNDIDRDVAISYNYTIVTTNVEIPNSIFFDPFTYQKAEYIISNRAKISNEFKIFNGENLHVEKTETGKNIVGYDNYYNEPKLQYRHIIINQFGFTEEVGRWQLHGYVFDNFFSDYNIPYISNGYRSNERPNDLTNSITLKNTDLPQHTHDFNNNLGSVVFDQNSGSHSHQVKTNRFQLATGSNTALAYTLDTGVYFGFPSIDNGIYKQDGAHQHNLSGTTGNITNQTTQTKIDIRQQGVVHFYASYYSDYAYIYPR